MNHARVGLIREIRFGMVKNRGLRVLGEEQFELISL